MYLKPYQLLATLSTVSTGMGDCLRAGTPTWYVTKPTRSTQPCIPFGSLNRLPALIGWGKGGNVTSTGWQVTLCDPIWHVSSHSGAVLVAQTAIRFLTFLTLRFTETFFTACIVNIWNSLPNSVVDANCVNAFKARPDKFWLHQKVTFDFTAVHSGTGNRSVLS